VTAGSTVQGLRPSYPIRTERLDLRPHRIEDLDDLLAFHSDPDVVRYVPWPVRDRAQTSAALERKLDQAELTEPGQWLVLAVELRDTGTVIGEVLLKWESDANRQGELGFALHSGYHGLGLAAEAAEAVLRLGFDELGLHRISALCLVPNVKSARLLGRLGMRLEAHMVHSALFKGEWSDQLLFAITETEWRAGPPNRERDVNRIDTDRAAIAEIVRTFFAAFTSGPDSPARLLALRQVLHPGAVIVRTCGLEPAVYSVEDFIAPRAALLSGGKLVDFHEWEVSGRTEIFGDIAQHFCTYAKAGVQDGTPFAARGKKTIQFIRVDGRWLVISGAWDDERDGVAIGDAET
jgi:RimJ/RimL family protein N-acetyltransferase